MEDPFESEDAAVGGSIDDLEATQAAREEFLQARDEQASEELPVERTQPWEPNALWDGDTSMVEALAGIGNVLHGTNAVLEGWHTLCQVGGLDKDVAAREMELRLGERILIYAGLQLLGVYAPEWRLLLDTILNRLDAAAEPTPEEDAKFKTAEMNVEAQYAQFEHEGGEGKVNLN